MRHQALAALILTALPACALAQELPPGLTSARLLPGWTTEAGTRMTALELVLEPGWKTYWRSPGDSGLPPVFDWSGSRNLGAVALHWPAPEVIDSGGERTLGYHDRLVLPVEVTPADPAAPIELAAGVDLGLCLNICVPARLDLTAPAAEAAPDPAITAALSRVPEPAEGRPGCTIAPIRDGMQVSVALPAEEAAQTVALELDGAAQVWVSAATVAEGRATADFVGPTGKPFDLDPAAVVTTLIAPDGAREYRGCTPAG